MISRELLHFDNMHSVEDYRRYLLNGIIWTAKIDVPAEGVVDYQEFDVDLGLTEDRWVRGVEIRPGNPAVVHHANVFLKPPGSNHPGAAGALGSACLATVTQTPQHVWLPEGMAKRLPAGWRLMFVVHYTPNGKPAVDRTSVALTFVPAATVRREVGTMLLMDEALRIPPHAARHEVRKQWTAPEDVLLLALFPHMHLRGKSFAYDAVLPDGRRERLLEVPRFDFAWQHRYEFAAPKRLPKGTVIEASAVYDNSAANPSNPDPSATVFAGKQSWDEMFNGYFDWTLADETLFVPPSAAARVIAALRSPVGVLALLAAAAWWGLRRIRAARNP